MRKSYIFVLEGLLEQQTGLRPTEIMTDTTGTSDIVFGLFWLLGYQFSPRLADAGEAVFWRIDKGANYGLLNDIARDHTRQSMEIREEDKARLSPLGYGHLNVLGHYSFTLADQVLNGQLRPLNQNDDEIFIP